LISISRSTKKNPAPPETRCRGPISLKLPKVPSVVHLPLCRDQVLGTEGNEIHHRGSKNDVKGSGARRAELAFGEARRCSISLDERLRRSARCAEIVRGNRLLSLPPMRAPERRCAFRRVVVDGSHIEVIHVDRNRRSDEVERVRIWGNNPGPAVARRDRRHGRPGESALFACALPDFQQSATAAAQMLRIRADPFRVRSAPSCSRRPIALSGAPTPRVCLLSFSHSGDEIDVRQSFPPDQTVPSALCDLSLSASSGVSHEP
jgi:hypothetical protein